MRKYGGTVDRIIVFCEVGKKVVGNNIYASHDFDTGGDKTFDQSVGCSASGHEPATHLMVSHVVDQKFLNGVLTGVGNYPFFNVYKQSEGFTTKSALADISLQVVTEA